MFQFDSLDGVIEPRREDTIEESRDSVVVRQMVVSTIGHDG
jgi:hypothetical protein